MASETKNTIQMLSTCAPKLALCHYEVWQTVKSCNAYFNLSGLYDSYKHEIGRAIFTLDGEDRRNARDVKRDDLSYRCRHSITFPVRRMHVSSTQSPAEKC